ncbi:MAG: hypothetical protein L0196_09420 [candidate division Zixibacteria bacterium]|nr:hypothetical protein [candidate division Zixibacteria bacterium]
MRRFALTVFAMLLVWAVSASAKPRPSGFGTLDKTLVVTPMGGLVFPTGDFGDAADMGFLVGSNLEYFVHPRGALSVNLGFHSFGSDVSGVDGPDFFLIGGGARGFLYDDAKINPYGRVAGGLYQGNDESNVGINFGVGGLYRSTKSLGFFAEGGLHFVFGVGTGASETANFFGFTGGLVLSIPSGK